MVRRPGAQTVHLHEMRCGRLENDHVQVPAYFQYAVAVGAHLRSCLEAVGKHLVLDCRNFAVGCVVAVHMVLVGRTAGADAGLEEEHHMLVAGPVESLHMRVAGVVERHHRLVAGPEEEHHMRAAGCVVEVRGCMQSILELGMRLVVLVRSNRPGYLQQNIRSSVDPVI